MPSPGAVLSRLKTISVPAVLVFAAISICSTFYIFHVLHFAWYFILLLTVPVIALNSIFAFFLWKLVRFRLQSLSALWPEFLSGTILLGVLYTLVFRGNITILIVLVLFLIWLFVQLQAKRSGNFYTGWTGIVLFSLILGSYRLLNLEGDLLVNAREYLERKRLREAALGRIHWEKKGPLDYILQLDGKAALEIIIPEEMFFHGPEYFANGPGIPLGFVSASVSDPSVPPSVGFFEIQSSGTVDSDALKQEFEMILGQMENKGEIEKIKFVGQMEMKPPESKAPMQGMFWQYKDLSTSRNMLSGIYVVWTKSGPVGLVIIDPITTGFRHHPNILYILQNLTVRN